MRGIWILLLGAVSFFGGLSANAEEIRLVVTDPSGAPVSAYGRMEGSLRRNFHTDAAGHITLASSPPRLLASRPVPAQPHQDWVRFATPDG